MPPAPWSPMPRMRSLSVTTISRMSCVRRRCAARSRMRLRCVGRDPDAAHAANDVAEALARRADRRRVDDRHQLLEVLDEHAVEENLVAMQQRREPDVPLERRRGLVERVLDSPGLVVHRDLVRGQQAVQAQSFALLRRECRALVEQWIADQVDAGLRDLHRVRLQRPGLLEPDACHADHLSRPLGICAGGHCRLLCAGRACHRPPTRCWMDCDPARRARLIDGKALAAHCAPVARRPPRFRGPGGVRGLPWCWSATIRRARSMSATRTATREAGMRRARAPASRRTPRRPTCWPGRAAQRRSRGRRHPRPAAAAAADRRTWRSSTRSTRTRTSTASTPSTPGGWRRAAPASCPARRWAACTLLQDRLGDLSAGRSGGDRPLEHRRQADGAAAAAARTAP